MSKIDRAFDLHCVPKDVQDNPGPGHYLDTRQDTQDNKVLEQGDRDNERYNKLNPFGKGDPRFDYQRQKVGKERVGGPTGDFNIHMDAVIDKDVVQKREAIQDGL